MATRGGEINYTIGFKTNASDVQKIIQSLDRIQKIASSTDIGEKTSKEFRRMNAEAIKLKEILSSAWNSKLNQLDLNKVNKGIKDTYGNLKNMETIFKISGMEKYFKSFQSSILNTNVQLKTSNQLLDKMAITMANTVRYGIASSIFNRITGEIQRAYGYSVDLDKSLNDIRIVSDKSAEDMERFAKSANKAAKALGSSTLDYTQASTIYYQQGLSDEETAARTETTLKAANVTGQAGEEVSEQLTAIWNGYKVTAEETELYIDKVSKIAATSAADLEELATGMSKVASAAKSSGVDIDQLNATLATVISVTREAPETIGTAFKTIYARLGDLALDGQDEYGVTLGNVSSKLHSLGIEILDESGNMRDMGTIVEETAEKWDTWTQGQKQAAAVAMAGKMQYSRLIALFDNWDMYTQYINDSRNAVGSLQEQQDIYMESTVAHLQQLSTEAEKTYDILFDAETTNNITDMLTGLLSTFNTFLESIGGGSGALVFFGATAANIFNKQIGGAINQQIENFQTFKSKVEGADLKSELTKNIAVKYQSQGINIDENSTRIKTEAEYAQRILDLNQALTDEEKNQLTLLQQEIALGEEKLEQIEEERNKIIKKYDINKGNNQEEFEKNFLNKVKIEQEKLQELQSNTLDSNIKYYNKYFDKMNIAEPEDFQDLKDEVDKLTNSVLKSEEKMFKQIQMKMKDAIDPTEGLERQVLTEKEINLLEQLRTREIFTQQEKVAELEASYEEITEEQEKQLILNKQKSAFDSIEKDKQRQLLLQNTISALSDIVVLMNSISNIARVINDNEMTTQEKTSQILMLLLTTLPSVLGLVTTIPTLLGSIALMTGIVKTQADLAQLSFAQLAITMKAALIETLAVAGPYILAFGLAIAAVTAAFVVWYKEAHKAEDYLKDTKQTLNEITKAAEEASQSYEKLKSSWKDYSDAENALNAMIKGTKEWNEQVLKVNESVLSLLDKYPQLVDYISSNDGILSIDETGYEELLQQQQKAVKNLQNAKFISNIEVEKGSQEVEFKSLVKTFGKTSEGMQALVNALEGNEQIVYKDKESIKTFLKDKAGFTYNLDSWAEAITKNKEALLKYVQQLEVSNKKIESYTDNLIQSKASESKGYQDSEYKTAIDKFLQKRLETLTPQYEKETQEMSKDELGNAYAAYIANKKQFAIEDDKIYTGDTLEEINEQKKSGGGISINDALRKEITQALALNQIQPEQSVNTIDSIRNIFNKGGDQLGDFLISVLNEDMSKFSQEDIVNFSNKLNEIFEKEPELLNQINEYFALSNDTLDDIQQKALKLYWTGAGAEKYQQQAASYQASAKQMQSSTTVLSRSRYEDLDEDEKSNIDALEEKYKELGKIQDKNSQEYIRMLRLIKEQEEDNALDALNNADKEYEKRLQYYEGYLKEIEENPDNFIAAGFDIDQLRDDFNYKIEEVLDEISKNKYQIQLQLEADMKTDINDAFDLADQFSQLSDVIEDDLQYTYDEAQKLIDAGYGAMFENAKKTAEGVIEVNNGVLQNFIDNKQQELETDKDAKIGELNNERAILVAQEEILDQKIALLTSYAESSGTIDEAELKRKVQDLDQEYENETKRLQGVLDAEYDSANKTEDINEQLYRDLGGMYSDNAKNQQLSESDVTDIQKQEIDKRIDNVQKLFDAYRLQGMANAQAQKGEVTVGWSKGALKGGSYRTKDSTVAIAALRTIQNATVDRENLNLKENTDNNQQVLRNTINAVLESTKRQKTVVHNQIGSIDAAIAALQSASLSLDKKQVGAGKGKSGSEKDAKQQDYLEDEKDRYHDIDIILKQISKDLDVIQKQQNKLFGKNLINNLNEQISLLDKQIDATNKKLQIAVGETAELRTFLSGYGVAFNADSTIANYADAYIAQLNYVNSVIDQYNSLSAEGQEDFEETLNQAKNNFDTFVNTIGKYDTLITDTIPGLYSDIQDAIDKEIEINISKFNMEIEIRLDMSEAERDWNEFKKTVIDGIKDDDILGNAAARLRDFNSYYKDTENGIIQRNTAHINDLIEQLRQIDETGTSSAYGDNKAQALEDLKTYYEQLTSDLTDIVTLQKDIHNSYLDMIDEAGEKFKQQVDLYEHIKDIIDHDIKLIQLLNGEDSYAELTKYYEMQNDNYNKQLDFQRQQKEFWKAQMDIAEEGSDEWEKAREKWINAVSEWNSTVENAVQNVQDKYLNAINNIFKQLNNKVTNGLGLNYVSEQWNLINKKSEQYLDTVNAIYGVQQLENKYLNAIDDTDAITGQKKLNNLMDEELDALRQKDKLTQYDLDRADLRYQIALKQIALEEAQRNKSSLRLRRDSQGNYSYQFVADNDEIANLQQEISDLYNQLYNLDLDKYRDNLDQAYTLWEEFQEKMLEAAQINDPEEREQRELLLRQEYGELINGIIEQNEEIRHNMYESTFLELIDFYNRDTEAFNNTLGNKFENLTEAIEQSTNNFYNFTDNSMSAFETMVNANLTSFENMSNEMSDIIMNEILTEWNSGVQGMINKFSGEGGFEATILESMNNIRQETDNYKQDLDNLQQSAGVDFNNISSGIDNTINETQQLLNKNDELIDNYHKQLDAIRSIVDELDGLINKYNTARDAAIAASEAAYKYWQEENERAAESARKEAESMTQNSTVNNVSEPSLADSVGQSSNSYGGYSFDEAAQGIAGNVWIYAGWGNNPTRLRLMKEKFGEEEGQAMYNSVQGYINSGNYFPLGNDWKIYKRYSPDKFDTGGYTGSWGSEGRLALLHQKELVLNKQDTENFLNAVNILRKITDNMNLSLFNSLLNMKTSANNMNNINGLGNGIEQQVKIEASFPNVSKANEIEQAFDNLINIAAQKIYRN